MYNRNRNFKSWKCIRVPTVVIVPTQIDWTRITAHRRSRCLVKWKFRMNTASEFSKSLNVSIVSKWNGRHGHLSTHCLIHLLYCHAYHTRTADIGISNLKSPISTFRNDHLHISSIHASRWNYSVRPEISSIWSINRIIIRETVISINSILF